MMCDDGEYWFPCSVHFCQLAMRESVQSYFEQNQRINSESNEILDWDEMNDDELLVNARNITESSNTFRRITNLCRTTRTAIMRKHSYAELFRTFQRKHCVSGVLLKDVPTRFDSTLQILRSIHKNSLVIRDMQRAGFEDNVVWPLLFHFSADDFSSIRNVVEILQPIEEVTFALSAPCSWVGDVLPLLTSAVDTIRGMDVVSNAKYLQRSLIDSLSVRIKMLLGVERELPFNGGTKMGTTIPMEYIIGAYLNPRYSSAIHACYAYSERTIISEMMEIYSSRCNNRSARDDDFVELPVLSQTENGEHELADELAARLLNRNPGSGTRSSRCDTIRNEFVTYRNEISGFSFTARDSRKYWLDVRRNRKILKLGKIARLLLTVPASAVPQECHFSE